ncbi:MAG: DNA polymerase III subunit alpha, partial [Methylococcaceae bacterium]|nr:DNA polymerase III subunit alpha [Methylococcaceae bacterium]
MQPAFIHLRLHTEFSLVDGIVKIKPLVKRLAELNMPAIAVTDHANLFSLVKFYKAALGKGIKPIAGADVLIFNPEEPATPYRLTLLVNNHTGYTSLTELISKAYQEGQHQGVPMLRQEWIEDNHRGLIALSGAMGGDIGKALLAENHEEAKRLAEQWGALFEQSFYLELQRVGKPDEERYIAAAVELALATGLPVVATNDVRFIHQKDFAAHEVRVCINQGRVLDDTRRPKDYTEQQYLRSTEEMLALFADIPEALENTLEIAKRCNLKLTLGKNFLPDFPVPAGMTLGELMANESQKGLEERLHQYPAVGKGTDEENRKVYYERLDTELKVITEMGFPGYFMIVADFIQWAKNEHIPVGPGRGSGAGSLVAYALKITDLDPIEFDLLFERFLNPERVSMPDFDIDFCMDRRDEVIDYVARHYGRDHVAQIITYGSMAAKAVIRDVGRVLGFAYGFVDRLAKLIPFEIGMTLTKALKDSPELKQLYDTEEEVKTLIDMALSLEGTVRNAGKHAGGVVISPTKLTDFTPLYCEEGGGNLVTQFDKDDVEAVGLVKFDFLGLRTLTIIDWALQTINHKKQQTGEAPVDITTIPRDDAASYVLLKNGQTTAVFQLESRGMKELIKKLKPDCFDDIIALVALFRPGPLESGMVDDYINVKHGAKAEYAHPLLEPILKPTNGVILYQEQVMQIARELAHYTLGGADMLRRAMGKKKAEEMAKEREKFTAGAVANQVDEPIATYVFDLMEKFAGYGFNKSHSAAYALVAYQTAWLKAHYPAAFMAAVLSSDMDNTDKVVVLIEECRQMKLVILPPTINVSTYRFTVNDNNHIVYGLGAIKGVGQAAIEEMLKERDDNGRFSGLYDLCKRV